MKSRPCARSANNCPPSVFRSRRLTALRSALLVAGLLQALAVAAPAQVVAGYYPEWRASSYPPSAIPLQHLTHVIHAFAWPNADGSISYPAGFPTPVPELTRRAHAAGRKVLVSLGGALDSDGFSPLAASAATRAQFISNLTAFCLANGYDGVDLDWEFPASLADRQNLNLLVQGIRAHWNQVAPGLMLTMTIGADDWTAKYFDVATLHPLLDWIDVMTYCYYGSWSGIAGHNAPLYSDPRDPLAAGSADESIRQYFHEQRGVPYGKMTLGIPFYGLTYTGTTQLYHTASGGSATFYKNVAALNYAYNWDGVSWVPYLVSPLNGGTIVPFDDPASVRLKCMYARSKGLAGVAIWELSQDVVAIGNQPLLEAIGEELLDAPPPPPPPATNVDVFATGEIRSIGTVAGSIAALQVADDAYESLKEGLSGGPAKKRYSSLAHVWTFDAPGGSAQAFFVQAHHSASSDGDHFAFAYSTNNVKYVPLLTVVKTADDDSTQTCALPAALKGKVYVKVVDTDHRAGKTAADILYVDQMFIRSTP